MSDTGLCDPIYSEYVIPKYDKQSSFLFISSSLEFLVFLFLLCSICRKQYYIKIKKNPSKAKQILSPFYDKIIYWYCIVTITQVIMYLIKFASGNILPDLGNYFILIIAAFADIADLALEMFIPILLLQKTIGKRTFKKSAIVTLILCIIECIFVFGKYINIIKDSNNRNKILIWEICIDSLLLLLYIFIYCYVFIYQQKFKQRNRVRDRILKIYLLCISLLRIILITSFILPLIVDIDTFCFTIINEYLYNIIFPFIAFITIRNDSLFWQNLFFQLQNTNYTNIHSSSDIKANKNEKDRKYDKYRESFDALFGNNNGNDNGIVRPLVEAAETIINIIDFSELFDISDDPIAAGSTSIIHTGIYRGEKVAIKQLQFDEMDLNLNFITDLFRESLNSNIDHINIVKFKGVCLRPPELCLIYEYCNCGDLSHLLLWKYYNNNGNNNINFEIINKATQIENRLKILIDIAYGMTELHDKYIIHRDLKTDNILVKYDKIKEKFCGKVCDFGSARVVKTNNNNNNKLKNKNNNNKSWIPKSIMSKSGIDEQEIISVNHINFDPGIKKQSYNKNKNNNNNNVSPSETTYMTTKVGTFAFMAPELLIRIDINQMIGNNYSLNKSIHDSYNNNSNYVELTPPNAENYNSINSNEYSNTLNKNKKYIKKINKNNINFHHNTQDLPFKILAKNKQEKIDYLTTLYDGAIDVFAFGVIMWEIGFLKRIYENKDLKQIHNMITNGKREYIKTYDKCQMEMNSGFYNVNINIYNQYINLMNDCWAQNISKRPKFNQIRDELEQILDIYCNQNKNQQID